MFNENEEYHLWILSIGAARQDLFFVNKQIVHLIDCNSSDGILYYAKMSAAHVNESLALLKKRNRTILRFGDYLTISSNLRTDIRN